MLEMRPTRSGQGRKPPVTAPRQASSNGDLADGLVQLRLLAKLIWHFGVTSRGRLEFWQALWTMWRRNPSRLKRFLTLLVMGYDILCFTEVIHERAEPALVACRAGAVPSVAS